MIVLQKVLPFLFALDINSYINIPQMELNLLRAMVLRKKYNMVYSQRLKDVFRKAMSYEMDYAELEKVLSREQIRRYKKEMLSEEEIKDEILTIFK